MWYGWPAMLDLKAKLAAAGLVTPADVAAAERKGGPRKPAAGPRSQEPGPGRDDRQHGDRSGQADGADRPRQASGAGQPNQSRQPGQPNQSRQSGQPNQSRQPDPSRQAGPANQSRPANQSHASGRPQQQPRPPAKPPAPRSGLDAAALLKAGKGAAYDAIRRAVDRARLDAQLAIPSEQAEAFHFTTAAGQLSRLMLEPAVRTALADGTAGIVAFMSHHGLAHCVVPRPLADDIFKVFPLWLRVLRDHPGAGQQEPPREPPKPAPGPAGAASTTSDPTPGEPPKPAPGPASAPSTTSAAPEPAP